MIRKVLIICTMAAAAAPLLADEATVRVEPLHLQGPRPLARETQAAVVRDYLEAWKSMSTALSENRADVLNNDFVGDAREKLGTTVQQQAALGIQAKYQAASHDIRVVFYSPDGLSVQLEDNVQYDEQILDHGQLQGQQHLHARYVVVLTPAEVRWRVRVLQAMPE